MSQVIDRRGQPGKTGTSRDRFLDRNKGHIKKAVDRAISGGGVTDIGNGGVDVTVPKRDLSEPFIHHGQGGVTDRVFPGNKEFVTGDRLPRGGGGGGGGGNGEGAGQDGGGEDDFTFHLSEEEFLNYLFDDLELPNMEERNQATDEKTKLSYAGIVSDGPNNKLHLQRSKQQKMGRKIAAEGKWKSKILELLAEERDILNAYKEAAGEQDNEQSAAPRVYKWESRKDKIKTLTKEVDGLKATFMAAASEKDARRIDEIDLEIAAAKKGISMVPGWNESTDLKFKFHAPKPVPNSKAVMFCVMDVSGSMTQEHKDQAKIFYFLLYRFLKRHYQKTDVVFIRHHTSAEEVNEQDFFYKKETGGTMVSSALKLMKDIIDQRYGDGSWNVYGAQASDGDNWGDDTAECKGLMKGILDDMQAYFYVEITRGEPQSLWHMYQGLKSEYEGKFWMAPIRSRQDIFPVFRDFFQKRGTSMSNNSRPASLDMK